MRMNITQNNRYKSYDAKYNCTSLASIVACSLTSAVTEQLACGCAGRVWFNQPIIVGVGAFTAAQPKSSFKAALVIDYNPLRNVCKFEGLEFLQ